MIDRIGEHIGKSGLDTKDGKFEKSSNAFTIGRSGGVFRRTKHQDEEYKGLYWTDSRFINGVSRSEGVCQLIG